MREMAMTYRVVAFRSIPTEQDTVCEFSNAYAAVDFMTSAWFRGDGRARVLHLVDDNNQVLLAPDDLINACALEWATC